MRSHHLHFSLTFDQLTPLDTRIAFLLLVWVRHSSHSFQVVIQQTWQTQAVQREKRRFQASLCLSNCHIAYHLEATYQGPLAWLQVRLLQCSQASSFQAAFGQYRREMKQQIDHQRQQQMFPCRPSVRLWKLSVLDRQRFQVGGSLSHPQSCAVASGPCMSQRSRRINGFASLQTKCCGVSFDLFSQSFQHLLLVIGGCRFQIGDFVVLRFFRDGDGGSSASHEINEVIPPYKQNPRQNHFRFRFFG